MSTQDRGALVLELPQTFTRKNWPFAVFLAFLGAVLAIPAWQMGNVLIAFLLFFLGFGVAFIVFAVGWVYELFTASVLAVYEHGLLVRQRGELFVRWRDIERIEKWTATVELVVDELHTFMRLVTLDGRAVALGSNPKLHDAVLARAQLSPIDQGHKGS